MQRCAHSTSNVFPIQKHSQEKSLMKKKQRSRSAFFNPRIILSFILCSVGVFLTLLGYGAFSNTFAAASNPSAPDPVAPLTEETEEMSPADANGRFVQLIEFAEPGVLQRTGHNSGEHFKTDTPQARAALEQVKAEQVLHILAIANAIGRQPEVTHRFTMTHSGIATRLTQEEAQIVRKLPGVASVEREKVYHADTFRSPFFIGADKIWDGSSVPGGVGTRGQGIVIADLDTGLVPTHPSFINDASCGHGVGGAPNKLMSQLDCATTDGTGLCNGPSPNDTNGHGSHTASTAGGNVVPTSAVPPPTSQIQGIAPCANLRMYKVCPTSSCPSANITAGINSVLLHGDVDAMNFSISGGNNPWTDNDRRFLDLVAAGIVVSASAGNTSATITNPVGNVAHLGPWVMTVAASTKDAGGPGTGDILASFSLRGPTSGNFQTLTKPDVTGPGVNIYAAVMSSYGNLSGTSMSCPHMTGSAALVRKLQPTWLPEEVKSALMMTSLNSGFKENGSTPWDADDVGTGRVDLTQVAKAGLVMNETFANFLAADPATGGDPKTLNIPSARNMNCTPSCTFTRTVRNTKTVPTHWTTTGAAITPGVGFFITVSPPSFNFTGNLTETQVLTITAFPSQTVPQPVLFGEARLTETGGLSPLERITVAIKGTPAGGTPSPTPSLTPGVTPTPSITPSATATPCAQTFSNPAAITIPATGTGATTGAPANPYPSNIAVAGLSGTIIKVTVRLNGIAHTFPDDIDILLVGPGGQTAVIMSDVGGGTDVTGVNLVLDDAATVPLPDDTALVSGTFDPTNIGGTDAFPAPAPAQGGSNVLAVFNGTAPNGTWSLYVVDDAAVDIGSISNGWDLIISSTGACGIPQPSPTSDPFPTSPTPTPSATGTATATATPFASPSTTPTCFVWQGSPPFPHFPDVAVVRAPGNYFPANGKFYSIGGRSADTAGADFTHPFEYDQSTNTWATKPSTLPDGLVNNMACGVLTVSGTPQIYCVGGSQSQVVGTTGRVFSYNPATDTFSTLTGDNWPGSQTNTFLPGGFAVAANKLYIIGSFNANAVPPVMTAQVWQFDPTAAVGSKWLARADYPLTRSYVPAATIAGNIYTGGGSALDPTGAIIDSVESFKYDPVANAWTPIASIPRATGETRAVTMGGTMWVLGGGRTAPNPSNQVNIYNPAGNSWTTGPSMIAARRNFPADSNGGSIIFVAGGYDMAGLLNTMERFGDGPCPTPPTPTPTPTPTATVTATIPPSPTTSPTNAPPSATPTATATIPPISPTPSASPAAQAINLSTRMNIQTGANVGIGGFIITGSAPKNVLLRGIGPSLTQLGIPNALADPVIELHGPSGFSTIINNNWRDTQEIEIQATGIPPTNNFEAAIVATLNPGSYTAIIKGNNNGTGIGLIEVYDLSQGVLSKLGNISTRAHVGTGADVVIAGFILGNNSGEDHVIIRGIGPSLTLIGVPGALANPALELRDSNATLLISNNDWQDDMGNQEAIISAGLALSNDAESGISAHLPPGLYTAILSGQNNTTGVGLVEVYDLGNSGGPGPSPTPPPGTPSPSVTPPPGTPSPSVTPPPGTPSPSPSAPPVSPTPPPASPSPSPQQCLQPFDSVTPPALPAGWTATLVTGDPPSWVTTTATSDSPPNNAFVPDQDGISDKTMDSCNISIFSPTAQIKFRNSFNTEHDPPPAEVFWDGFVMEVSVNGGAFGDIIDAGASFVSGGYTGEIDGTANNPLAGRQAWSGDSGGYIDSTVNLPASFNGQTIKIRFRIGTDEAVAAPGVHVDGFQVIGGSCSCSP
jgi:subtilisin-like proprotein convertase family protein